jgi:flagellar hook-associated protein 2
MAGEIYYPNITGAFDWDTLLQYILQPDNQRIADLQRKVQNIDKQIQYFRQVQAKLNDLYSYTSGITKDSWFNKKAVNNTNPDVADVSIIDNTIPDYTATATVNKVAQIEIDYFTKTFDSMDDEVGEDVSLTFKYKTASGDTIEKTIDISADDTLQDIIDKINNDSDLSPYIHAYAIYTGDGYQLALMETSVENSTVETDSDTRAIDVSASNDALGDYKNLQEAKNSELQIGDNTYTSAGYTFKNVLPGLEVKVKDTGTFSVNITTDYNAIAQTFTDMVDKVNQIIETINDLTKITKLTDTDVEPAKVQDSLVLKELKIRFQNIFMDLLDKTKDYNIIDFNTDGTISVDTDNLIKFLKNTDKSDWDVLYQTMEKVRDLANYAANDGYVGLEIQSLQNREERLNDRISDLQQQLYEKQLYYRKYFAHVETYLAQIKDVQNTVNSILIAQLKNANND